MDIYKSVLTAILILLISSVNNFVQGQETELKSEGKSDSLYFKSESLFKCNIKLPENYNTDHTCTLVIGLHGGGGNPDSFIKVWGDVKDVNFIYATPQAPYPILFDKLLYEWSLWSSPDLKLRERAAELIGDYIADIVGVIKKKYKIDNIYLLGHSQGAVFTYIAGLKRYQLYKGILIFSGPGIFEPLGSNDAKFATDWMKEKYLEPAKTLRVFITHAEKDPRVKYELGVKSYEILSSYGYDVTFYSFDGGHTIDSESLKRALEWINNDK
jgi:predicted esterase